MALRASACELARMMPFGRLTDHDIASTNQRGVSVFNAYQLNELGRLQGLAYFSLLLVVFHWAFASDAWHGFRRWFSIAHPLLFPSSVLYAILAAPHHYNSTGLDSAISWILIGVGWIGMVASSVPIRGRAWVSLVNLAAFFPFTAFSCCESASVLAHGRL